jgi:hypothetical protein
MCRDLAGQCYSLQVKTPLIFLFPAALLMAGCSLFRGTRPAAVPPPPMGQVAVAPVAPRVDIGQPLTAVAAPLVAEPNPTAVALINEPKYKKIVLRGYIDEKGRAIGPQEIVQEVTPGGINPAALDNWEHAYIPASNVEVPSGMGSRVAAIAPKVAAPADDLLVQSPSDVIITQYYKASDKAEVESMARQQDRVAHFDPALGWVLLKKKL